MRRLGWPLFGAMAISVGILSSCSNPTTSSTGTVRPNTTATSLPLRNGLTPIVKSPGPVPSVYQSQYTQVRSEVSSFAKQVGKAPAHPSTTIGTELLAANGNIGTRLLTPGALSGVEAELDAFRALGIDAVTVAVSFPLLLSTTPQSSQYLSFYEQVAQQVRLRHMVLSVEENPIFSGTPLTSLSISYAGLTPASYASEQQAQAQLIVDDLQPEYLTILTEPDTFTDTLGIDLDSPGTAVAVVNDELDGLRRGNTAVGAGTGTWSDPAIDQELLAQTSIDYLDVHVYPLGPSAISNLTTDVHAATAARKAVVMDEAWLNKPTATEGSGPRGAPEELKVKSYSFWEPLDEQFVSAMVSYARSHGFAYVSLFDGARCFFGYLTWSPTLDSASYQEFSQQYNRLVSGNMSSRDISETGVALYNAIHSN